MNKTYIAVYPQLKELFDQTSSLDAECVLIDLPLEEGNLPDYIPLSFADRLALLLPHDVRSHVALRYIAKDFNGDVEIIPIQGKYTDISPLAICSAELKSCLTNGRKLSDDERCELCSELKVIQGSSNCYFRLIGNEIAPLPMPVVDDFILEEISGDIREDVLIGRCMGNAPKGWPITDVFYLNRIDELIHLGRIAITKVHEDPLKQFITIRLVQ